MRITEERRGGGPAAGGEGRINEEGEGKKGRSFSE